MSNALRIILIVTAMLVSFFINAVEFNDTQKCNEIKDAPDLTIQYCTAAMQSDELSDENLADVIARRGYAYYQTSNYEQAIIDFNTAIQLNPKDARFYIVRGMAYEYAERNYNETVDNFSSAILLQPKNARYYNFRCWARVLKGDAELALFDCNQSLDIEPNNPNAYDSRGIAHFALGNYQAALADYNKSIELNSEAWSTHLNRARVHEILGNTSQAEADKNIARKNAQGEEQYKTWLGSIEDAEKNNRHHRQ